jgi:hypothetical protein
VIVDSQLVSAVLAVPDRWYVVEIHTNDDGRKIQIEGLQEAGDFQARMLARVPEVEAQFVAEQLARDMQA